MFIMHIEHRPLTGYLSQMLVLAQAVLQLENQLNGPLGNFFCVGKSPDVEEHIKPSHSWTRGKLDWKRQCSNTEAVLRTYFFAVRISLYKIW